jgi:hypothetical protein
MPVNRIDTINRKSENRILGFASREKQSYDAWCAGDALGGYLKAAA